MVKTIVDMPANPDVMNDLMKVDMDVVMDHMLAANSNDHFRLLSLMYSASV